MAHTFLKLIVNSIPQATKDNVPAFWKQLFSNDGVKGESGKWIKEPSYLLFDAYNMSGELVHSSQTLKDWVQWSDNPEQVIYDLISEAKEITYNEHMTEKSDTASIWYADPEEL